MANWISSNGGFRIDNAAGSITDIKQYLNSVRDAGGANRLDDTGLGDARERSLNGLARATQVQINGSLNSTTYPIFAPLVNGTSVTKTVEIKYHTGKYRIGEVYVTNVELSQNVGQKSMFSCTLDAENGLTTTSVAAS